MRRDTYIQERYRVDAHLGTGDLGSIWDGTDTLLNRPVTIKVLHPELARDDAIRDRFRHTATRVAALGSTEIIDIYDHIEQFTFDNEVLVCQITGRLSGTPLSRLLRRDGRLNAERTLTIIGRTARALHLAHQASVVHRNLKPGNVLVRGDDAVTLIGFGFLDSHATPPAHSPDQPSSSVPYAAPELFDNQPATAASDIYSLGVIGYECLTGRNPFDRETATDIAMAHARVTPAALSDDMPWQARHAVTRALAKRPSDRHESARVMAKLCGVTDGFTDTAAEETAPVALPAGETPRETAAIARGKARVTARPEHDDDTADEQAEPVQGDLAPVTARRLPSGERHKSYKYSATVAVVVLALTGSGLLAHFGFPVAAEESQPGTMLPTSESSDSGWRTPSASSSSSQESSSSSSSSTSSSPTPSTPPPSSSSSSSSSSDPTSEPEETAVPSVIGLSPPEATGQLQSTGLGANVEHEGEGDIECAVHAQDPAAGTELPAGSTVTVNVRLAATEEECQQPV